MPRPAILLLAFLSLIASGCSKQVAAPTEVRRVSVPPMVIATQPPARSTGVLYDTDIWVQFDRSLEPSTVSALTVFLKQDSRRLSAAITYDGLSRRIVVRPNVVLNLQTTYTVEMSPRVRAAGGDSLGATAFFQFTTNSLRRPRYDRPTVDAIEGPHTSLMWSGNGLISGNISYEIYVGEDSAAVAARLVPYIQRAVFLYYLPRAKWPQGVRVYWAVTAINLSTGERLDGAVTRFRTYAADVPVDSVFVPIADWGGRSQTSTTQQCTVQLLNASPAHNAGIRFGVAGLSTTLKVADARIELPVPDLYAASINTIAPLIHFAQNDWVTCAFSYPGPPFPEVNSLLATGAASSMANKAVFASDAVGAFLEGQARRLSYYGIVLRSSALIQYGTSPINGVAPRAVVYYYPPGSSEHQVAR